ncbi:MAG: tetratricopeptide repeat protein [Pseudomonadota bacterium]
MSELHAIAKPEGAKADVVFIHGLADDPFACWQHDTSKPEDSWPYWLASQRQDIAVWTLGYEADKSYWTGEAMALQNRAKEVLTVLELDDLGSRPIIFVCHSMGGLVAKHLLRTASDMSKPEWRLIRDNTRHVLFLATPHAGADLATLIDRFGKLFKPSAAIQDLKKNAPVLMNLNEWYRENIGDLGIKSHAFYETRKTSGVLVVEQSSADPGITGVVPIPIGADHRSIVKPTKASATLCRYLDKVIDKALLPEYPDPEPTGGGPEEQGGKAQKANTRGSGNTIIQISGDGSNVNVGSQNEPTDRAASSKRALGVLPPAHGKFIGRDTDLKDIRGALLDGGAVVTAVGGMGGIGKTATGLEVVKALREEKAFPDGVLFVDLFGFTEGREPLSTAEALVLLLRQLVGSEGKLPDEVDQLQLAWRQMSAGRRMLLFLDNARDAEQIKPLLPGDDACRVLTTSRHVITLPGLKRIELGLLSEEDAIELAMTRANQDRPDRLSREQAERLAACCGRHPLAIEVTVSTLNDARSLNVEAQIEKLGSLEKTALNMDEVKAVLRLSLDLLEPAERAAWCRLGVFEGDFDAEAAKAVMDVEEADAILATLEIRNLVAWQDDRLQLHDILRAIALEDLEPAEREAVGERHSRHYKDVLAAAEKLYLEGEVLDGLQLYDRELHQILAGQAFTASRIENTDALARLAADYANAGVYVLLLRLTPRAGIAWLNTQAAACRKLGDRQGEGSALCNLGIAYAGLGEPRRAIEHYEQVLAIFSKLGDRRGEGSVFGNLGNAYAALGELRRAIEYYEQVLAISREIGDRRVEGSALGNLGIAYADLDEPHRAIEYYEQQLVITTEIGDRRGEGNALGNLGIARSDLGEPRRAIECLEQALVIAREIGDRRGEARARYNGAEAWRRIGDEAKAIDWLRQALAIEEAIEDPTVDQTRTRLAEWTAEHDAG